MNHAAKQLEFFNSAAWLFVCYGTNDISKDVSNRECFKSIFCFAK